MDRLEDPALKELVERLKAAPAGSCEMDAAVVAILEPHSMQPNGGYRYWIGKDRDVSSVHPRKVTTSLDAVQDLGAQLLPDWIWQIDLWPGEATVQGSRDFWGEGVVASDRGGVYARAKTAALAFSAAILTAKGLNP